ncbi:MAG: hypothetical protein ABFD83_11800, partial [Armatimonadota bacterium]
HWLPVLAALIDLYTCVVAESGNLECVSIILRILAKHSETASPYPETHSIWWRIEKNGLVFRDLRIGRYHLNMSTKSPTQPRNPEIA